MKTLEEVFRNNGIELTEGTVGWNQGLRGKILEGEYTIHIVGEDKGQVIGYMHPTGRHGDTVNFTIKDNQIIVTNVTD